MALSVVVKLLLLFNLIIINKTLCLSSESTSFKKWENIINEGLNNAANYKMPKENSEFIPRTNKIKDAGSFDFIVVGTGAAGGVIANGLAQIKQWKVLIIEAGEQRNDFVDIPAMNLKLGNTKYNWNYKSEPLKNSGFGRKDPRITIKRGKGLGGTTLISGLRYARGSKYDWDQMQLDGNPGWSYKDILPYMKKIEKSRLYLNGIEDVDYHGHDGKIHVEYYNGSLIPQFEMMVNAHKEAGYPHIDFNGRTQLGIGHAQLMSLKGRRSSTGSAFIDPIKKNKNVVISDKSLATKVLINEKTKIAKGVIYSRNKQLFRAYAKKEVILSGGSINTPQLLMLSGVGPSKELNKHKIKLIKELPVGQNLIDHPVFDETVFFNTNIASTTEQQNFEEYIRQYGEEGYGPLTIASGIHGVSFYKTKFVVKDNEGADIAYDYIPPTLPQILNFTDKEGSVFKPEVFDELYKNVNFSSAISMELLLLNPLSRGSVTLKSANAFDYPIIDLNHFSDPQDMEKMLVGIKIISRLENTRAFRKLGAKMAFFHLPACKAFAYRSKEFWECTIRETAAGGYHPFGTCRMGQDLKNSVVDHNLIVHGIPNLRVIDASVLRKISGYPVSYLFAISAKAEDLIKNKYNISH